MMRVFEVELGGKRGTKDWVVKGWRSRIRTSKIELVWEVRRVRGKQENRLVVGLAGIPLGESG